MKDAHIQQLRESQSPSGKGSKVTSWVTAEDGTLVEADLKYLPVDEGAAAAATAIARR